MKRIQDRRIAWTLAMGLILIAILVLDGFSFSPEDAGAAEVPAPEFNVGMLTGEMYTSAMLKGQATLLAFWAPWCHVCQRELPGLAEFAEHDKRRAAVIRKFYQQEWCARGLYHMLLNSAMGTDAMIAAVAGAAELEIAQPVGAGSSIGTVANC